MTVSGLRNTRMPCFCRLFSPPVRAASSVKTLALLVLGKAEGFRMQGPALCHEVLFDFFLSQVQNRRFSFSCSLSGFFACFLSGTLSWLGPQEEETANLIEHFKKFLRHFIYLLVQVVILRTEKQP